MRIWVTGCAGFIGSQLVRRLIERGDEVIGLDNFDETLYSAELHRAHLVPLLSHPSHRRFTFHEGDILDAELCSRLAAEVDVIVHLAALAGVRPSLSQAARYLRVNVEGTQNILDAARAHGRRRIVFASSSSVYGARSQVPFRETDVAVAPASPYAASKRAGELICSTHADLHGASIAALRFFTVYGPHQRPEMAIAKFARLILEGGEVPLFGNSGAGSGGRDETTARDYTYVDDILDGIEGAIERTADPHLGLRVYNLGGAQVTTLSELVSLLEEALGLPAKRVYLPLQPGDVPITSACVARAEAELGYRPKVGLREGLRRTCEWLRATLPPPA
jgi:UDP-glucuronate 4-epimerase